MRVFRLAVPIVVSLFLSACAGPPLVIKKSEDPKYYGEFDFVTPQGYPAGVVLKPHKVAEAPAPAATPTCTPTSTQTPTPTSAPAPAEALESTPSPVSWNEIGDYDQWLAKTSEPAVPAPVSEKEKDVTLPAPIENSSADVTVFSLDGTDAVIAPYDAGFTAPVSVQESGLVEKVYFPHASAKVTEGDKAKLHKFVKQSRKDNEVEITVVGHASHRVDRVNDPVKRKMINLKMAQKRANAVTDELKKAGLKPAFVRAVSKGDEEPNTDLPAGMDQEAADRRAEVYMDQQ